MRLTKIVPALASALLLAVVPATAADLTVVYKVTGPDGTSSTTTDYFTKDKFRSGDAKHEVIFDVAAGRMTTIDHGRREYSDITLAEMESAMKAANMQMEAAMKSMPPEMREKMAGMMGGAGGVQITSGGAGRKVAGYDTQHYIITIGPAKTESWNSSTLQSPIEPGEMLRLQSLAGPSGRMLGNALEEFKKVKGFPLASTTTVSAMGRTMTTSREATEVKTGPLPASAFDLPAGYKKVASPLTKMMQGR